MGRGRQVTELAARKRKMKKKTERKEKRKEKKMAYGERGEAKKREGAKEEAAVVTAEARVARVRVLRVRVRVLSVRAHSARGSRRSRNIAPLYIKLVFGVCLPFAWCRWAWLVLHLGG
jgi:hypothetical protein